MWVACGKWSASGRETELILRRRLRLTQDDGVFNETFSLKSVILSLSKDQFRLLVALRSIATPAVKRPAQFSRWSR
jgi:hypothetical protein